MSIVSVAAKPADRIAKSHRRDGRKPVDVRLTVRFRFGEDEHDTATMIDDRQIPMVGGILDYRDRIIQGLATLMFKAAAMQPKIIRELTLISQILRGGHEPERGKKR